MYVLELGGEDDDFAAREARSAATDVRVVAPGVATAATVAADRLRGLAYTHRASRLVARTDAAPESARAALEAASLDRTGSVAVRARDVKRSTGVDTQAVERTLGAVLVDRGFSVDLEDPDHELRALFSRPDADDETTDDAADGVCLLGWLDAESERDFGERKPTDKPFFQPGSMDPLLARALVNVAGAGPGTTLLDPMCGTGGVLVEAGLVGARVVGADAQQKMARGAARNLDHFLPDGEFATLRGDATHLPLRDDSVDAVVFDAPYGRQSKIAHLDLDDLVAGALVEARRVADRAVVVGDRRWAPTARDVGWSVESEFERRVHRSLTRHVVVLE